MKRAAILIGVDKTGELPKLKDAARGAKLMAQWAQSQGIAPTLITDENSPVTIKQIKDAVRTLVDAANVQQLLVYFAGHGVNLQRQEYWLLSDAPDDSQAAVNVATSAALAATCGIPHVVFMSDACRTAPEGIQAQSIRGSEIFPNREEDMHPVDQFFACQLGKPSHEIKDPAVTTAEFRALYTHELVPALMGERPQLLEFDGAGGKGRLHLRPLRDHLAQSVAARLAELQLQTRIIQVPVAQISSDPPAWISEVAGVGLPSAGTPFKSARGGRVGARGQVPSTVAAPEAVTTTLLRRTLDTTGTGVLLKLPAALNERPELEELVSASQQIAAAFGPTHHETGCGFKLRGARVVEAVASRQVDLVGAAPTDDLRVHGAQAGANVLLVLEGGAGVLLPAIPEFMCALTFDEDELLDVAYEPSEFSWRYQEFIQRAEEIRSLRGIASAAMARGSFKLERDDALPVARRMQLAKGVDPSLSIYAAYAYHELQERKLLNEMHRFLCDDLGAAPFDVALLARQLDKRTLEPRPAQLLGPVPLLSQGWALLRAFQVRLQPQLAALETSRLPSLWSMFDSRGVDCIRTAFQQGVIQ